MYRAKASGRNLIRIHRPERACRYGTGRHYLSADCIYFTAMLHLYQSNRLEHLFETLSAKLRSQSRWRHRSSRRLLSSSPRAWAAGWNFRLARAGIAANLRYPLPASFFWDVLNRMLGTQKPAFGVCARGVDRSASCAGWRIRTICSCRGAGAISGRRRRFPPLRAGAAAGGCARPLPDHRPTGCRREAKQQPPQAPDAQWQARLWRDLVADAADDHRAASLARMLQLLQRGEGIERLPQRVSLVGISSLPPVYLELLKLLGQHIDEVAFCAQPVPAVGDIRDVAEQARSARTAIRAELYRCRQSRCWRRGKQGGIFRQSGRCAAAARCIRRAGRRAANPAHCLQQDVLTLTNRAEASRIRCGRMTVRCRSTSAIARCAKSRCCNDQLLVCSTPIPACPADVVVLTPDIELYAPFIDAVYSRRTPAHRPCRIRLPTAARRPVRRWRRRSCRCWRCRNRASRPISVLGLLDTGDPYPFRYRRSRSAAHPALGGGHPYPLGARCRAQGRIRPAADGAEQLARRGWRACCSAALCRRRHRPTALPLYCQLLPFDDDIEARRHRWRAVVAAFVETLFQQAQALTGPGHCMSGPTASALCAMPVAGRERRR